MKKIYVCLLIVCIATIAKAQNVTIPNAAFKNILVAGMCTDTDGDGIADSDVDANNDGEMQVSEALAVTNLKLPGMNNITGINAFANLQSLDCSGGGIAMLNIAGLHSLKSVNCSNNGMYSLALSGLDQLETLDCSNNQILSILNFSGLDHLKNLNFSKGRVMHFDASDLPALEILDCSGGSLNDGLLSSLTVAPGNAITTLICGRNRAFNFDLSFVPALKTLQCDYNSLNAIDVSALIHLESLDCSFNNLSDLNILNLGNLKELNCSNNNLTAFDFSNAVNLQALYCSQNNITSLDTSNLSSLKTLDCNSNVIADLTVNGCIFLETVNCYNNELTHLDASNLAALKNLNCAQNLLTALSIANLGQLEALDCNHNPLPVLDLGGLVTLKTLNCSQNQLPELGLSGLIALETLNCGKNNLATLDVSNSMGLKSLSCSTNQISNLNLGGITTIETLNCAQNQLSALDITHLLNLKSLDCSTNQISAMTFDNLSQLRSVNLSGNLFTTLDFSQTGGGEDYYKYYFNYNPNLTYINIKNGAHIKYCSGSHPCSKFETYECPNLQFICADDFNLSNLFVPTAQVSSYCSFTPGGVYNTITGKLTFDYENNGCDDNDEHPLYSRINIVSSNESGAVFTNAQGRYTFYTQTGDVTITPTYQHPYFTVAPDSATVNFAALDGSTQNQDFCIIPNGVHNDLSISLLPSSWARPGFDADYFIAYANNGNQILSGNISLAFDDAVLDLVSANPAAASQSLNSLSWNYSNLLPFETRYINFTFHLNSPQETPALNIGDVLHFNASIDPVAGDETPSDNTTDYVQILRGSYDPNDKICLEGETIVPEKVGDYLTYMIRFQNLGTAAAENIVVKDLIDSEKYDIATLQLIGSSHPQQTKITGDKAEFIFQNIHLPAAIDDEPGSHGYVAFKIKTKSSLVPGDSVSNTADINFDYNFPVTTNTATTTVALLSKNTFEDKSVSIFPNPAKDKLNISAKQNITSIQLYDVQGRLVETTLASGKDAVFSIAKNASGIYFIKIYTEKGIKVEKIIKE